MPPRLQDLSLLALVYLAEIENKVTVHQRTLLASQNLYNHPRTFEIVWPSTIRCVDTRTD